MFGYWHVHNAAHPAATDTERVSRVPQALRLVALVLLVLSVGAASANAKVVLHPNTYRHGAFIFRLTKLSPADLGSGFLLPGRKPISHARLDRAARRGYLRVGRHQFHPAPPRSLRKRQVRRYRLKLRGNSSSQLRWPPPALTHPTVVNAAAAPASGDIAHRLSLSPTHDYLIRMPARPLTGGLVIVGGHNVVLIGGEIDISMQAGSPPSIEARRGLYLKGQTGTAHVEGLLIDGPDLSEGINLDESLGAVVQIENVRVEDVHARDESGFTDNHPDVLQTWAGPAELRVDRLTGSTDYQGMFLAPNQFGTQPPPREVVLSHVDLRAAACCYGYLLWQSGSFPLYTNDVWVTLHPSRTMSSSLWPSPDNWSGVSEGTPPGGEFVPTGVAGASYKSPGYQG